MSTMMRGNLLHYMECPGTVNLNAETYLTLLTEVGTYVMKHEFRQLISSNGHGGNIAPLQLEIHCTSQNPTLCVSTTYRDSIRISEYREHGEETS